RWAVGGGRGAWGIPGVAAGLARCGGYAAGGGRGWGSRGNPRHYEQVADGCSEGLMRASLDTGVPVLNGVLAVEDAEDAERRAGGSHGNKGEEAALVAIEMAELMGRLP